MDQYQIVKRITKSVKAGVRIMDNTLVVIKEIPKENKEAYFLREVANVPGCAHLIEEIELPQKKILIIERPKESQDLFDYISINRPLREDIAKKLFRQVLDIVYNLYTLGISHRDIKDENFVIQPSTNKLWLIDFDSAGKIGDDIADTKFTKAYMPPEWHNYGEFDDVNSTVWSLGILLYNMLYGNIPFEKPEPPLYIPYNWSNNAKDLVTWCLSWDPSNRPNYEKLINHPWVTL
jgi:serine/threonine protein kinase